MKTKLINSNKYKRFKFYLIMQSIVYGIITFLFLMFSIVTFIRSGGDIDASISFLLGTLAMSFVLVPFILYYGINMILMRTNDDSYVSYAGLITEVNTPRYIRSDYRTIFIEVEGIERILSAKVYMGSLYDEVSTDKKIEIAYNELNEKVIPLNVI